MYQVLYGRSLGALSVIHLAAEHCGTSVNGLIVESGLVDLKSLPLANQMLGLMVGASQAQAMSSFLPDPIGSIQKVLTPSLRPPSPSEKKKLH